VTRWRRQWLARSISRGAKLALKPFGRTTKRSGSISRIVLARLSPLGLFTTIRAQLAAQVLSRSAQLDADPQPAGMPCAIRSSMSSSEPWIWPITGTSGRTRAAASFRGVRWWR
jgi:hypothetical protein